MADQNSTQYALQLASTAGGAKIRSLDYGQNQIYVNHTPSADMSANDVLNMIRLDTGATRIILALWHINRAAFGAGRTLNFGHRAYRTGDGTLVAENLTFFGSGFDVAAAGSGFILPGLTSPNYSPTFPGQVILTAQVVGGTWPSGTAAEFILAVNRA